MKTFRASVVALLLCSLCVLTISYSTDEFLNNPENLVEELVEETQAFQIPHYASSSVAYSISTFFQRLSTRKNKLLQKYFTNEPASSKESVAQLDENESSLLEVSATQQISPSYFYVGYWIEFGIVTLGGLVVGGFAIFSCASGISRPSSNERKSALAAGAVLFGFAVILLFLDAPLLFACAALRLDICCILADILNFVLWILLELLEILGNNK